MLYAGKRIKCNIAILKESQKNKKKKGPATNQTMMLQFSQGNKQEDGPTLSHLDFSVKETDCHIRNHPTSERNIT